VLCSSLEWHTPVASARADWERLCAGVTSRGAIVAIVPRRSSDNPAMREVYRGRQELNVSDDAICQSLWTRCSRI
jgi:hypothetical protein